MFETARKRTLAHFKTKWASLKIAWQEGTQLHRDAKKMKARQKWDKKFHQIAMAELDIELKQQHEKLSELIEAIEDPAARTTWQKKHAEIHRKGNCSAL